MYKQKKSKRLPSARDLLLKKDFLVPNKKEKTYVTKEFQDFGLRLAHRLNDMEHKALYIKLAKETDRNLLEQVLRFTDDYPNAKSKGKIFMWKLKELKDKRKAKENEEKEKQYKLIS